MPLSLPLDALLDVEDAALVEVENALHARAVEEQGGAAPPFERATRPKHRRARSDPTDWLRSHRGRESPTDDEAPSLKRSQSCGLSPERKRHAPAWLGVEDLPDDLPKNKKDVPMWTMEEDLFIMDMVEQYGKRWSKIAAQMPGRTDNGVRNRWNRMEKAQSLRELRGPRYGYRCRRCGQPKRGHTCAALSTTGDAEDASDAAAGMGARVAAAAKGGNPGQGGSDEADEETSSALGLEMPHLTAAFIFGEGASVETAGASRSPSEASVEGEGARDTESSEGADDVPMMSQHPQPPQHLRTQHPQLQQAASPAPPALAVRPSEEPIDEQKLDDFLRDLQLSAGLIPGGFGEASAPLPPMTGAPWAAAPPLAQSDSLVMSHALDYFYPVPAQVPNTPAEYIVPRSPRALGVC